MESGEADVGKVTRKRKNSEVVGDEIEVPHVQAKRARKRRSRVDFSGYYNYPNCDRYVVDSLLLKIRIAGMGHQFTSLC